MIMSIAACISDEENKSSNGNSADTEGEEESEIGEKSLDKNTAAAIKLHYQPVSHLQDKNGKHDPNRYMLPCSTISLLKCQSAESINVIILNGPSLIFRNLD